MTFIQRVTVYIALACALPHLIRKEPRVGFQHVAPEFARLSLRPGSTTYCVTPEELCTPCSSYLTCAAKTLIVPDA